MLKNILFTVSGIVMLASSSTLLAAEPSAAETPPAATMPTDAPAQPAPTSQDIQVKETAAASTVSARPLHDNHVDYRYCLELKSDREIIECRYKK